MIPKFYLPASRKMITLAVRHREFVTPGFARLTLGGPGVRDLVVTGNDQTVRLFFPREGQDGLRMPTVSNEAWMAQVLLLPKSVRPWVRNLTIRTVRPSAEELDIEFALHGESPMSSWVRRASPGDPAGIFDTGSMYRLPEGAEAQVLIGDETALPAFLSILDGTPPALPTSAFVEVASAADIRPGDARIRWFPRDGGSSLVDAVRAATLPPGRFYTWVAGESRLATSVRRHLVNDRGVAKRDISFYGYWRQGRPSPG